MSCQTADLCDRHADQLRVLEPILRNYGAAPAMNGPVTTLKVFEDNSLVRAALETAGEGRVLVIDGGGSRRCALVGDQLAALAVKNGWAGIVVWGCIRDSAAIAEMPIGVYALATHPLRSVKRNQGERDIPVTFGGVRFQPNDWLYADADGIVVTSSKLHED